MEGPAQGKSSFSAGAYDLFLQSLPSPVCAFQPAFHARSRLTSISPLHRAPGPLAWLGLRTGPFRVILATPRPAARATHLGHRWKGTLTQATPTPRRQKSGDRPGGTGPGSARAPRTRREAEAGEHAARAAWTARPPRAPGAAPSPGPRRGRPGRQIGRAHV